MKRVAKKGAESYLNIKKTQLKRPSRALYNEEERKERRRLYSQNVYYRKQIKKITDLNTSTVTLSSIQDKIPNDEGSEGIRALLADKGYFNDPEYSMRDIREWMQSNGDDDLLDGIINIVNEQIDDPNARISDQIFEDDRISDYRNKINENEQRRDAIKQNASDRKNEEMLRYMDKKNRIETGNKLLDSIVSGEKIVSKLSNPEQEAINYAKRKIANAVITRIDFDKIPEEYRSVVKDTIYTAVMNNPVEGLRNAMISNVSISTAKKYGTEAGKFAGGLMSSLTSIMTGKPNLKPATQSAFGYMVSRSKLNRDLMQEVSEDLVSKGLSTNDKENAKMLSRDILIDIGKDIISSGGDIFVAIPKIIKDVLLDSGQAGIRKIKYDKVAKADKEKRKKQEKAAKEQQKKFEGLTKQEEDEYIKEMLKKFDME